MKKAKKLPEDSQVQGFKDAAKSLECDESEERFDETLKKVAQHKPRDTKTITTDLSEGSKEPK